jgi:hypothetical protein
MLANFFKRENGNTTILTLISLPPLANLQCVLQITCTMRVEGRNQNEEACECTCSMHHAVRFI